LGPGGSGAGPRPGTVVGPAGREQGRGARKKKCLTGGAGLAEGERREGWLGLGAEGKRKSWAGAAQAGRREERGRGEWAGLREGLAGLFSSSFLFYTQTFKQNHLKPNKFEFLS
jgi:hypothetical protein